VHDYTIMHTVGDVVGLVGALGEQKAIVVGHDWGAPVAWNAALTRPDRFVAVAGLSVPYTPRGGTRPTEALSRAYGDTFMYMLYFQTPGVAEAELERDVRSTIRRTLFAIGGEGGGMPVLPKRSTFLEALPEPAALPGWLTEGDVDFYVSEFTRTGFRGGLNWYRNLDRTWELMAAWRGAPITVPALFIAGDRDPVILRNRAAMDNLATSVPGLRERVLLPGTGHWTQQERPGAVNDALVEFLSGLPSE
jgi:pimeloyl-ACP methyl ester carboxylesterase